MLRLTPDNLDADLPRAQKRARKASARCAHCAAVVSEEQAIITGPVIEGEERFGFRPVVQHYCRPAQGVIYLYVD